MDKYEKKLSKIIHSMYLEQYEISGRLQVASSLICIGDYHGYVYGAGKDVDMFVQYFEKNGIRFHGIIDRDKKKCGTFIRDVKVISPEEFVLKKDKKAYVLIYTLFSPETVTGKEILDFLLKAGVVDYSIVGNERYSICGCLPSAIQFEEDRRVYYQKKEEAIKNFLNELDDTESKEVLLEFIRSFMESSVYRLEQLPTIWKYFYGRDRKDLYKHNDDEVWVNFGANVGDTIFLYFRNGLQAKKIYAIEGNSKIVEELRYNLKFLPNILRNKIEVIEHFVRNDNYFASEKLIIDEKISLINCDIEGAELEMLHQMKNVIKRDRPVLAICLYHKKEDIIEIPKFINSIVDNYFFKLRKYVSWCGNIKKNQELVLYAIPEERRSISDAPCVNDRR